MDNETLRKVQLAQLEIGKEIKRVCDENNINLSIPDLKYCTDNAAMIGAAGYYAYKLSRIANLDLNSKANDELR